MKTRPETANLRSEALSRLSWIRDLDVHRCPAWLLLIAFFVSIGVATPETAVSGDYMVSIQKENYKEKMITGTGDMKVDHTWEVKTRYGGKILILVGTDYSLRQWIRTDAQKHRLWVVKIPPEGDDDFKYNMSIYIDLQQVHPVGAGQLNCAGCRGGQPPAKRTKPPA
jgi:hypothetical protein